MIPKIVHYIWFGEKEKNEYIRKCIDSWKKNLIGYEFREWNEYNFDVTYNEYTRKSYEAKKYAFTSDVARLWALYNYGGIYMDTDVMVYRPLDKFLKHSFFTGFEQKHYPVCATMGAEKGNPLIKEMLDVYKNKRFELKEEWYEYETNTMIMSDIIGKYFDRDVDTYQYRENMAIYPIKTFCSSEEMTEEVYTRHLMFGSWGDIH